MKKILLALVELLRIIAIVVIGLIILWNIETLTWYRWFGLGLEDLDSWLQVIALGNLLLLYLLYRNKLQFSGWYKSESNSKLPKKYSYPLGAFALILINLPVIFN